MMHPLEEIFQLQQAGELQQAKKAYLDFLQDNPNSVDAIHLLAILYAEEGNFDEAINLLKQAIFLAPDNPNIKLHLANILKAQGNFPEAKALLIALAETSPNFPAPFNNLGTLYFATNEFPVAIKYFQRAIDLQPNFVDAYYNLGLAYVKNNQFPHAVSAFKAVLELAPDHPGAIFQLGIQAMRLNNFSEALNYFLKIIQVFPFHFETQSNLGACYLRLGNLAEAKRHYLQALEINPQDLQVLFNLGVITTQQSDIEGATQYYLQALAINPHFIDAHNNLAIVYLGMENREAAKKHFIEVLRLQADNPAVQHTVDILDERRDITSSPAEYIQSLFDSYADHYDSHLLGPLQYQVPKLLYSKIQPLIPNEPLAILDLGAGTGLSGELFLRHAHRLVGVDLSEKMLAVAAQKNIYSELVQADILHYLQSTAESFDLILAADVIVYFGDLANLFPAIAAVLASKGLFAFNIEIGAEADYQLSPTGRFTHRSAYIEQMASKAGFNVVVREKAILRKHQDENVDGLLFVLQKQT